MEANDMNDSYEIRDISKEYARRKILKSVTMTARAGECVGIAGTNGIGKSTLLRILAGVEKPSRGSLTLFGHDLLKERGYFAKKIAYVPQENPLLEELTALDNLKLWSGRRMTGLEEEIRPLQIDELMHTKVSAMSGGMKRRLSIACALTGGSPVLVMDEPTAALDLYHKDIIYTYLDTYRKNGGMILLSTHDLEEMNLADRLYLLKGGTAEPAGVRDAAGWIRSGRDE